VRYVRLLKRKIDSLLSALVPVGLSTILVSSPLGGSLPGSPHPREDGRSGVLSQPWQLRQVALHSIAGEVVWTPEETRAVNRRNTELIRRRAEEVKTKRPDLADAVDRYVARQERETEILGTKLICALWLLRVRP